MPEDPSREQPESTGASGAGGTPPDPYPETDPDDPNSGTEDPGLGGGDTAAKASSEASEVSLSNPKQKSVSSSASSGGSASPPASGGSANDSDDGDEEEDGMLRMSFLEHLEELRMRIIYTLGGLAVAFIVSLVFTNDLWNVVREPAARALTSLGFAPELIITSPMEGFMIVWVKLPVLTAIFISSPWMLYQVWAFVSPGLYKRERRWATPFILCSAGLFILGGLFAYFVAFRFGLTFLLGIGKDIGIRPLVTITEYFDLFVNVTLGIAVIFELPVLIFFLTLLHIVTPSFLLRNSRYAILLITILAAIITPTPDAVNLAIFAVPMIGLYFIGVFASYLLVLKREGKYFPWKRVILSLVLLAALIAGVLYLVGLRFGLHFVRSWPFLVR